MKPHRPALRYFGGKWRIAPWIISHFPPHVCYVEPFAGAASVLLRKRPSRFEYLNDANGSIHNFWRVLRDDGAELMRRLELTPFSRKELELAMDSEPPEDPVERARLLYVLCWQGRSGGRRNRTGWRSQIRPASNKTALKNFTNLDHLPPAIARLREVALECDDAMAVLRRYDASSTLFYVDPPYLMSERGSYERYVVEFETEHDHRMLAAVLNELEGMVVLSGYPSELYAETFEAQGWQRHDREVKNNAGSNSTESLWLNPACIAAQRQGQLFAVESQ